MNELNNSVEDKSAITHLNFISSDLVPIETSAPTQNTIIEREETIIAETSLKPPIQEIKPRGFSQIDLADRLDVDSSTVGRNKLKDNFNQWSKEKDPNFIAWRFNPENSYYYPIYDGRLISGLFKVVCLD